MMKKYICLFCLFFIICQTKASGNKKTTSISVFLENKEREHLSFDVDKETTVQQLKQKILEEKNIPIKSQKIVKRYYEFQKYNKRQNVTNIIEKRHGSNGRITVTAGTRDEDLVINEDIEMDIYYTDLPYYICVERADIGLQLDVVVVNPIEKNELHKIKYTKDIPTTKIRELKKKIIEEADFYKNFNLKEENVDIRLLTDRGTGCSLHNNETLYKCFFLEDKAFTTNIFQDYTKQVKVYIQGWGGGSGNHESIWEKWQKYKPVIGIAALIVSLVVYQVYQKNKASKKEKTGVANDKPKP